MTTNSAEKALSRVEPADRILLLPHCLRPSETCPGKYTRSGMVCPEDCSEDCTPGRLRRAALSLGYKGVCIAPGGRLALRYVQENSPRAIVAIACDKELTAGVDGVKELAVDAALMPIIVVVPLIRDGCVDTEVDEEEALRIIGLGCSLQLASSSGATPKAHLR